MVVLFFAIGCKEYEPTELEPANNPQFWVKGTTGGTAIDLIANGSYRVNSGYDIDSLNVTYYYAEIVPDACQSCKEKFTLRWRADSLGKPDLNRLMSVANPKYRYIKAEDTLKSYIIELDAVKYGLNGAVTWNILGTTYTGDKVSFEVPMDEDVTRIPVSISADYDSCSSSLTDTVYLPNHGCNCQILARVEQNNKVVYTAVASGGTGYGYSWNFKDSSVSASSEVVSYYYTTLPDNGVERAEVTIQALNCEATRVRNIVIDSNLTSCSIHFTYDIQEQVQIVPAQLEIDLTELEIDYTDPNGAVFQSYWIEQSPQAEFQVLDEEDYSDPNFQSSKRSKKITAGFRCLLSNGMETIEIENGELVLPIGLGAD